LGFSLIVSDEASWIARMTGWTAGFVVLLLLVLGLILMIGERAGYWNPQALVGAELLVLTLQTGAFILNHGQADWLPPGTDETGGWMGWALGNLLVGALGRWPAAMTVLIFLGMGIYLLFFN